MNLSERIAPYIERWRLLEPRERRVVGGGSVVAAILIVYVLIWLPMTTSLDRLRRVIPRDRARLAEMQREADTVRRLRLEAPKQLHGNLMSLLERSATTVGVRQAIVRMEPSGPRGARVVFDHVDFNTLVAWLTDLQGHGIRVRRASIERATGPGAVSASLMLSAPPS